MTTLEKLDEVIRTLRRAQADLARGDVNLARHRVAAALAELEELKPVVEQGSLAHPCAVPLPPTPRFI